MRPFLGGSGGGGGQQGIDFQGLGGQLGDALGPLITGGGGGGGPPAFPGVIGGPGPELLDQPVPQGIDPNFQAFGLSPGVSDTIFGQGDIDDQAFQNAIGELTIPPGMEDFEEILPIPGPQGFFERLGAAGGIPPTPISNADNVGGALARGALLGVRSGLNSGAALGAGQLDRRTQARDEAQDQLRRVADEARQFKFSGRAKILENLLKEQGQDKAADAVKTMTQIVKLGDADLARQTALNHGYSEVQANVWADAAQGIADRKKQPQNDNAVMRTLTTMMDEGAFEPIFRAAKSFGMSDEIARQMETTARRNAQSRREGGTGSTRGRTTRNQANLRLQKMTAAGRPELIREYITAVNKEHSPNDAFRFLSEKTEEEWVAEAREVQTGGGDPVTSQDRGRLFFEAVKTARLFAKDRADRLVPIGLGDKFSAEKERVFQETFAEELNAFLDGQIKRGNMIEDDRPDAIAELLLIATTGEGSTSGDAESRRGVIAGGGTAPPKRLIDTTPQGKLNQAIDDAISGVPRPGSGEPTIQEIEQLMGTPPQAVEVDSTAAARPAKTDDELVGFLVEMDFKNAGEARTTIKDMEMFTAEEKKRMIKNLIGRVYPNGTR